MPKCSGYDVSMKEQAPGTAAVVDAGGLRYRWRMKPEPDAAEVGALCEAGMSGVVATLLVQRGLDMPDAAWAFLKPSLGQLDDPRALPGVEQAAALLVQAVRDERPIVVYGDYDVDGVTASAILWHTLTELGAAVSCYVPHRLDEGYGLNEDALRRLAEAHGEGLLVVTVDCGITATGPAALAKALGIELIITDHHERDEALPEASAIVHPMLVDEGQPVSPLCGAGVALKLAWQVARVHCGQDKLPKALSELMVDLVALAALGTVADVVPLVGENRVLTHAGLGRVKDTRFVGLNALIDASELRKETVEAYHVGFVLGPKLNAVGRLGHAAEAVELLTTATGARAMAIAKVLSKVNDERRATERAIYREAVEMIDNEEHATDDKRALVLMKEGWHPGVIGIVASRLVERYGRPTVMLSRDNGKAKGSARSVDGVCIHSALTACSDHLSRFGGHAMAAGMQLESERVPAFREAIVAHVNDELSVDELKPAVSVDLQAELAQCELHTAMELAKLAPFGKRNPSPRVLIRGVRLQRPAERMGQQGKHLSMLFAQGDAVVRAVAFGFGDEASRLPGGAVVDVVAQLKVNAFRGQKRAELHVVDLGFRD